MKLYLCKSCGKKRRDDVRSTLTKTGKVDTVGCQKVCEGPVVGAVIGGKIEWFERMDSRKALLALPDAIESGKLSKTLRKRRSKKRSGKRP